VSALGSTLVKLGVPLAATVGVLFASRARGLSWKDDLGLRAPTAGSAAAWLVLWAAVVTIEEVVGRWLHLGQPKAWPTDDMRIVVLRVLAIGIAGPVAEELVFRGALFAWVRRWGAGVPVAAGVTSIAWTALHFDHDVPLLAMVFVDGLLFAAARVRTGSIFVPMAMHVLGNLFSIWQSLSG